jgi:hypothetical protein
MAEQIKIKGNTISNILTSLASLSTEEDYTEYSYGDESFPVIEENSIKFAIIPSGTIVFKALPTGSNLIDYFKNKEFPYPSFYADLDTAIAYMREYFPQGDGAVGKFRTTRPVKLFILNDAGNLAELAKLFAHTAGVRGLLKKSRKEAVRELMMVTGLGTHCLVQDEFRSEVEEELDLTFHDYKLNVEICEGMLDEQMKRISLYAIDLQFSRNLCIVLKQFGNDGYISKDIPTAFGEMAPLFHNEMMFCFTSDVLEQLEEVIYGMEIVADLQKGSVSY